MNDPSPGDERPRLGDDVDPLREGIGLKTLVFHVHDIGAGDLPEVEAKNATSLFGRALFILVIPLVLNS